MAQKKLLYACTTNLTHEGIKCKVNGQIAAFQTKYNTKLYIFNKLNTSNTFIKFIETFIFQIKILLLANQFDTVFIRYNPKMFLLNMFIQKKHNRIIFEHNLIMETELSELNRPIEQWVHKKTLSHLKKKKFEHIAVNHELKNHLEKKGLQHVSYIQNGYKHPKLNTKNINSEIINTIKEFKKKHKKIGIFCGSGRHWHGIKPLIEHFKEKTEIGLIIAGPYEKIESSQTIFTGSINSDTLIDCFKYCDFGISNFSWHTLNIHEGSPLKSRQYLCHGLPILTNYKDCAEDIETLKKYVFNLNSNTHALTKLLSETFNHQKIAKIAQQELSWDTLYEPLFNR